MRPTRKAALAALVLAPLLAGGFILQERTAREGARLFDQVLMLVSDRFVDTLDAGALYERAARGLVKELNDPYSELLSPKDLQGFTTRTGGRYGGVGMQIQQGEDFVVVSRIFPNSPAAGARIQEGDKIVRIDTTSTRGWKTAQVSEVLLGEPGTRVKVTFQRPGVVQPIVAEFRRAEIHIPAVPYALMLDGGLGYVPLEGFNETSADEVIRSVRRLVSQGAKGLVLDMRGNPGGILEQSFTISNLFLPAGQEVLRVQGRSGRPQVYVTDGNASISPTLPVVILTDGSTASASEIVAGALQDHDRALVVGTTSFGKGLVQTLFPLDGGFALKMTTAKWFTPSGRSIQRERRIVNGEFVPDQLPDSLETNAVKKDRPVFHSDAGRIVYGGGGITPDVIVAEDTLSTPEQTLARALAPKIGLVFSTLQDYAMELKPTVARDFVVQPQWRDEFYNRLQRAGVALDRAQYDAAQGYVTRLLEQRVSRLAFGDSTARRREIPHDAPLRKAQEILRSAPTQRDLFTAAARFQPPPTPPAAGRRTSSARP